MHTTRWKEYKTAVATAAILLALTYLVNPGTSKGQINIRLRDISDRGSPLQTSGVVGFSDDPSSNIRYTYQIEGSFRNLTSKGIMLVVMKIKSEDVDGPPLDYTYENELFFGSDVIRPGRVVPLRVDPVRFGDATVNGKPITWGGETERVLAPTATVQVLFVQFVDGSGWGDAESVQDVFRVRGQTLRELSILETTLRDRGEQDFKEELSKSAPLLPCISSLMNSCSAEANSCLADGVRSMIESAERHQIGLKSGEKNPD
jgi:hypothetical protein